MDRFPKGTVLGGACILGLTLAMGWGGVTMIIKGQVRKEIRIINNTDTYRAWKDFPIPVYLSIYFFNITNPDEVHAGAKPKLEEVGPYVYMERLHKTDLAQNISTEIITFRQLRFYFFQPDMSTGNEDDIVTIPNVPLLSIAKLAQDLKEAGPAVLKGLDEMLSKKEQTMTVTQPVRDILFEGYSVSGFSTLVKELTGDPELDEQEPFKMPDVMSEEKYGFYRNKNGTSWEGIYEIHNGRNFSWRFGEVITYNGETETTWWKEPCNKVYGNDGLSFAPFINTTAPITTFEPFYCRSLTYRYQSSNIVQEVQAMRFTLAPETFQGPHKYPPNACYCPVENSTECDRNGVYDLAPCYEGFPFLLSRPHFLEGDPELINGVEGLSPNQELHETFLDMHSMSGIPLKTAKRFQFNIEMMAYPGLSALGDFPKTVVPIYWYQESIEAGSMHFLVFKIIAWIQNGWDMVKYGLAAGGGAILAAGILMGIMRKSTEPDKMVLVK